MSKQKTTKKTPKKTQEKVNAKLTENKRNVTWQANQKLLQEAYIELIQELKRCPTRKEISDAVNLSETTIQKHIVEMKFDPISHPLRVLTNDVIASIYDSSKNGSSASQKLWMQIMEGWREKTDINHSGGVTVIHDDIK